MIDRLRQVLDGLRGRLSRRTEDAYKTRDLAEPGSVDETYARGQADAYGNAEDTVREAQDEADR